VSFTKFAIMIKADSFRNERLAYDFLVHERTRHATRSCGGCLRYAANASQDCCALGMRSQRMNYVLERSWKIPKNCWKADC